jgi:hypothetical protein
LPLASAIPCLTPGQNWYPIKGIIGFPHGIQLCFNRLTNTM